MKFGTLPSVVADRYGVNLTDTERFEFDKCGLEIADMLEDRATRYQKKVMDEKKEMSDNRSKAVRDQNKRPGARRRKRNDGPES